MLRNNYSGVPKNFFFPDFFCRKKIS